MYPQSLEKLIECFRKLPSVGQKTAERYAMSILEQSDEDVETFVTQLVNVKKKIRNCSICGHLAEHEQCDICMDSTRNPKMICVVQNSKDVLAMEKMGQYHGRYHVLHGAISPIKGILPQDLNIESLLTRVKENVEEVIIATNPTMEGDTTALYLSKVLKEYPELTVTRLASGLPMGGNLDYADEITLSRALQGRIKQ